MYLEVGVHFYSSERIDSAGFSPACFILQTKNSSKDHFFMKCNLHIQLSTAGVHKLWERFTLSLLIFTGDQLGQLHDP